MKSHIEVIFMIAAVCQAGAAPQSTDGGEASRGAQLLRDLGCTSCHNAGQADAAAPDLERRISRGYSRTYVAGMLRNDAMLRRTQHGQSGLTENQRADLFAYFASRRFFELPGDAARGKRVFTARHCDACHAPGQHGVEAVPASEWASLRDPIAFAEEMWNRPPEMLHAFHGRGFHYPRLGTREVNDLIVYLDNLPVTRGREPQFELARVETGRALFQSKGCGDCHAMRHWLHSHKSSLTMAEISAGLWNHALAGAESRPPLSYNETAALVSYLWASVGRGMDNWTAVVFPPHTNTPVRPPGPDR